MAGIAGLLLTGGASRRLGTDKAGLVAGGERLGDRAARVLASVCDPVYELGPGVTGLVALPDRAAGEGPLAALASAGATLRARGYAGAVLVLAVDMPRVEAPMLRLLADWPGASTVVPEAGGRRQTTCARYGADALVAAERLVDEGVRSLRALLDAVELDVLDDATWGAVAGADTFVDVDTPADAARLGLRLPG